MKHTVKILGALLIGLVFITSCKKDTDPADRDFFIGTYNGTISYNDGTKDIKDEDGKVTVSKVGELYKFIFGSGIPDISGVKFEKQGDNSYTSVGDGVTGIKIDASTLKILVIRDGKTWTADCTR
jgi:hypothetical protein